jgi:hypothetical protein
MTRLGPRAIPAHQEPIRLGLYPRRQHRRIHQIGEEDRQPPNLTRVARRGQQILGLGVRAVNGEHLPAKAVAVTRSPRLIAATARSSNSSIDAPPSWRASPSLVERTRPSLTYISWHRCSDMCEVSRSPLPHWQNVNASRTPCCIKCNRHARYVVTNELLAKATASCCSKAMTTTSGSAFATELR